MRRCLWFMCCVGIVLLSGQVGQAATTGYQVVVPWSVFENAVSDHTGGIVPTSYSKAVASGSTVYAEVRATSPRVSWFVKVTNAGTSEMAAEVISEFAGSLTSGSSLGLSGDHLILAGGAPDEIYKISVCGGVPTVYVSKTELFDQVGGDGLTTGYSTVDYFGEMVVYETDVDQLVRTDGAGTVEVFLPNQLMVDSMGDAKVQGQLAFDGKGNLFMGNSTTDSIWKYDGTTLSEAISLNQLIAITGEEKFGVNAHIYNPSDGLMYMQDLTSRDILSYDPADPAGSLSVLITKENLENGPLGTNILAGFSVFEGQIAATAYNKGSMAYSTIPEPATMSLIVLGSMGILRRRKR